MVVQPWAAIYVGSLLLRLVVLLTGSGYIHPDEHLQCGQVAAFLYLKDMTTLTLPWEYAPGHLARSYLPADLMCGLPFVLYQNVFLDLFSNEVNMHALLLIQRLWMFVLSIVSDLIVYKLVRSLKLEEWRWIFIVRSTSWVSVVFATKTFSNALEGLLFDALMGLWLGRDGSHITVWRALVGGFIIGWGLFVRITFPAFGAVIGIEALRGQMMLAYKKEDGNIKSAIWRAAGFSFAVIFGILLTILAQIGMDSTRNGSLVVAPINNILYNMQKENLKQHGLHPLWTHYIVNLQILFGPLGILCLRRLYKGNLMFLEKTLSAAILVPLTFLSLFPHQEFRFLYPLFTPMVILAASYLKQKWLFSIWVVFNVLIGALMAYTHQAGLTTGLIKAAHLCGSSTRCCLWSRQVYMLPTYLLGPKLKHFRIHEHPNQPIEGVSDPACERSFVLGPVHLIESEGISGRTVWEYPGWHLNTEAGGITKLALVQAY